MDDAVVLNITAKNGGADGKRREEEDAGEGGFDPATKGKPMEREPTLSDMDSDGVGITQSHGEEGKMNQTPMLSRSLLSKPKSRFVESRLLSRLNVNVIQDNAAQRFPSPSRGGAMASSTPRSVVAVEEDDLDLDPDPFKDGDLPRKKHKVGIRLLLEWIAFVLITSTLVSTLTVGPLEHRMIWGLELWKWCLMILVIFCGRLVSGWLIGALVFFVERNFMLRKKVLYFVYGLRKSVQNCLWLGLVILTWILMFDPRVERSTKNHKALSYITRLLASFLVAAVIWLLKILLIWLWLRLFMLTHSLTGFRSPSSTSMCWRHYQGPPIMEIQQSLTDERKKSPSKSPVGEARVSFRSTLGVSRRKIVGGGKGEEKTSKVINVDQLHKMNQKNVSAWNMKRLISVIRHSGISTISHTIDQSMGKHDHPQDKEITSELEAIAAAKSIFKNVAKPGAKYIEEEDLLRFLKKNEVASIFPLFEGGLESGKIRKSALKNWVVNVYLERKSLAHSLNDTKTAIKQLHQIANAVVSIVITVVILLVMGIATTHVIVLVSSQLVLAGFIFGNTCKTIFEAIVFVFVMHPFDVGDRCVVDGVQMIVEEMNILTTVFLQHDNEKVYYPNSALATKPISNYYRSPDMGDSVEFSVDASTPLEKLASLKERIAKYLESKPRHWHPKYSVLVKDIENMHNMKMALYTLHTMNHQNMAEKSNRRSELVLEMKKCFEELGIKYRLLPQEVHVKFVGSAINQIPLQC
uniref:Mechanosensitive ion channel protein n=1 Tax=Chamaecyparis obtusa TaxID=13415 RepID=A0A1B4Z377_CHAOB|nr:mechanosensitive channels of small conductance-like [Chamaecyparis obtusa]